jgi:cathepsin C
MEHNRRVKAATPQSSFIAFSKTTTAKNQQGFQEVANDVLYEPDISFIELHNSDHSKLWRAGVHRHFIGRRMSDMMTMLGYRKNKAASAEVKAKKPLLDRPKAVHDPRPDHIKYHILPTSFDWRKHEGVNYDSIVKNQGNCGSCYAMATISVAEARIRIKSKMRDQTLLSSQAVVSCSIYNQGCDGGYPYLVAKHAVDFGLVPNACMEYTAENGECKLMRSKQCRDPNNPTRYYASNYSYIGGFYGGCSEVAMMEELYQNGPVMVAFDAPSSLFYYTGGIYTGEKPPQEDEHVPGLNIWEKTNHAVVAVGWGVDKGVKYWIIKNTWGGDWGENGYFRIRRGTDECGVESMASTLDMVLPEFESNNAVIRERRRR